MTQTVWYLVFQMTSSVLGQNIPGAFIGPPPLLGPISLEQCEAARSSLHDLPGVISATCKKAVGMRVVSYGSYGFTIPIFEGEITTVGSSK